MVEDLIIGLFLDQVDELEGERGDHVDRLRRGPSVKSRSEADEVEPDEPKRRERALDMSRKRGLIPETEPLQVTVGVRASPDCIRICGRGGVSKYLLRRE